MSPKARNQQSNQQANADTHSPWTEAFQTNPLHLEGNYDQPDPRHDEAQEPTFHALSAIYDTTERSQ